MGCFINFSNHPSDKWGDKQYKAAGEYGEVIDVPFPLLDADMREDEIQKIGDECIDKILAHSPDVVMCQGEFTLTYYVVDRLRDKGITCVSACTKRISKEAVQPDGTVHRESIFEFARFRRYL